ncbi:LPXTG cell wall anchor domain-containing protein [Streptomyces sp. NPDC047981]|uniref:LPXTG cell wall anchor domain-containing protein n=1 Tax=Streptomyces sp. NPDC047981 TaxID=3154610 RepID=UPI00341FE480
MRLRNALALGVTAATTGTAVLALTVGPSSAQPGPSPTCGRATDPDFPIDTRILGGPGTYVPGADFRTFEVELTNTTTEPCHGIHPVLALADRDRVLQAGQIRLDFYDSEARSWRPVTFEGTEEDENVGVFADTPGPAATGPAATGPGPAATGPAATGPAATSPAATPALPPFAGFSVPAGRTLAVGVRLAFREGTVPNEVVANAAVVQRQGDDGDWVGESGDYRLTIAPARAGESPESEAPAGTAPPRGDTDRLPRPPARLPLPAPPQLAETGAESTALLLPVSGALLVAGVVLLVAARRARRNA